MFVNMPCPDNAVFVGWLVSREKDASYIARVRRLSFGISSVWVRHPDRAALFEFRYASRLARELRADVCELWQTESKWIVVPPDSAAVAS